MDAKMFDRPPLSGDYEEHSFTNSNDVVRVKFTDENWEDWCGVFSRGMNYNHSIHPVPNTPLFWIIAGGQGYLININTRKLITKTKWDYIEAVIYSDFEEVLIISNGLEIGIIKGEELIWQSERISVDGVKFLASDEAIIKGKLNDLTSEWCEFALNITTKEIKSPWLFFQEIK